MWTLEEQCSEALMKIEQGVDSRLLDNTNIIQVNQLETAFPRHF
jgi:hypothetical protein